MQKVGRYYSQIGQDKYYIENIINHKMNGYFIDVGANNGINLSNTYVLEKDYSWEGLCIEVDDNLFTELKQNRNCKVVNECVYNTSGIVKTLQVPLVNEIPEGNNMLIRIKDNNPSSEMAFVKQFREFKTYDKISKTLNDIFVENNVPEIIDYMSIDIEGADYDALLGIDFNKYRINFITIEWGGGNHMLNYLDKITKLLEKNRYKLHRINNWDAEFILNVNSFDVFDTLLARRTLYPSGIFDIIEKKFPFQNFRNIRCQAENISNGTFDDIYDKFQNITGIDDNIKILLKNFEIEMEIDNSYLITTNVNRVQDGDILISDMYLNDTQIMHILRSIGFNKKVKLYASPGGKHTGKMWEKLNNEYFFGIHLGDNLHSDVNMAQKHGINAEHTSIHLWNNTELFFKDNNLMDFGVLLREFRHMNPYDKNTNEYNLYNDQAGINIPILYLLCHVLKDILQKENRNTILFSTRDSCIIKPLFEFLFPEFKSVNLQSSRIIYNFPNDEYKNYLKNIYNHDTCLIFDLHGSFNSGRELYKEIFGVYPRVHLASYQTNNSAPVYEGLTYSTTNNSQLELYNSDIVGPLIKLEKGIFIRAPINNYYLEDAIIYKDVNQKFIRFLSSKKYNHINIKNTQNLFESIVKSSKYYRNIRLQSNIDVNSHHTLTELADHFKTDKGSLTFHKHLYTLTYETILMPYYNQEINLLEIGLNSMGSDDIPSLKLWREYFGIKAHIYGFDINQKFQKHNGVNNIKIYTGDQSNLTDLEKCCENNYDIIIDDGSHYSSHQQISFKELWKSIKSGGVYVIENLHWQPSNDTGMKTKELFREWKNSNIINSNFISKDEANAIYKDIKSIDFYNSQSTFFDPKVLKDAICVIFKK